jgi:hypothetical protein
LAQKRRTLLRGNIAKFIDEAISARVEAENNHLAVAVAGATDPTPGMSPDVAAVLGKGCGLCRGECCSRGGNHAYLRGDAIARYMRANPEKSRDEVLEDYVGHAGERTIERSCAYHGPKGCTLPRDMRSNICNTFYCYGLVDFRVAVNSGVAPQAFMFSTDAEGAISAAFVDAKDVRVVRRRPLT